MATRHFVNEDEWVSFAERPRIIPKKMPTFSCSGYRDVATIRRAEREL
jgi:hypothetical protein